MNEIKQQHLENRNAVINCIKATEKFLLEHGYPEKAERMGQQCKNLENGEFSIAVVGEFSAGKSTFLNALMGEKILPSFTSETTATVNFLRHKNKAEHGEGGKIFYSDGRQEEIFQVDGDTISKYVSTNSTVEVAKEIQHLDLYLDSRFLEDNVTLVDTPGLNGLKEGHKELTQDQIEKSSASIFLFDANQPGSRSDFEFLTELRSRVKSILFVLNKIDNIKETEGETVESVIQTLKENYKKVYPDASTIPEIWPIAAYPALVARSSAKMAYQGKTEFSIQEKQNFEIVSRMKSFEDRIWKFLTQGEKAKQELMAPLDQIIGQLSEIQKSKKNEKDALSGKIDFDEVEVKEIELSECLNQLEEKLNAEMRNIKASLKNAEKEFKEEIESQSEKCKNDISNTIDNFQEPGDIDSKRLEDKIKEKLKKIGEKAYFNYCEQIREIQEVYCENITEEFNQSMSNTKTLDIQLDKELTLPEQSLVGIEEYEKESAKIEGQISKAKEEAENSEKDFAEAMKIQEKKRKLEEELKEKKSARNYFEENIMASAPPKRFSQQPVTVEEERHGVLGKVEQFLVGKKQITVMKDVVDHSERDEYLAEKNKTLKKKDQEIEELNKDLKSYQDTDPDIMEKIAKRKERALSECKEALEVCQRNFREKLKKNKEQQLKRLREEASDYLDEVADDFIKQCRESFRKSRDVQARVIGDMIGRSIREQIENKKKELELLKRQKETAVEEKEERSKKIEAELEEIKGILTSAMDLQSDIDSIKTDTIQEEQI